MTSRFAIAKQKLVDDMENVVAELLGAGARPRDKRRNGWNVCSPWRAGAKPAQTIVWLTGARRGGWRDFVSGDKGDAIDFVAWAREGAVSHESRMRAVEWAEDRYSIRAMSPQARAEAEHAARMRRQVLANREEKARAAARDRARKFFFSCQPAITGTLAETYLKARGIDPAGVPYLAPAFRFHPACEYWLGAPRDEAGRKTGKGPMLPAMISAMVDAEGRLSACHYTFLAADGRGKADVDKAKLMFPDTAGLVIRVTYGATNLNMERCAKHGGAGPAGVTEGIEDALSAAWADRELRMLAAGSLPGLMTVPDHAAVNGWLVFRDNDWGKPQAAALFDRAVARFRSFGKPVEVAAVPAAWGKDINDALQNEEQP